MIIGNKKFENYTYVMAIINLTPDSFWGASRKDEYSVLKAVEKAVKDGAAVIDIGAQSTRPGYTEVSADGEMKRLERPLRLIKENFAVPVSVDTYFSKCASLALSIGADMINDIWGLSRDRDMASLIAAAGASVCIMHNAVAPLEGEIFPQINSFLKDAVSLALDKGIKSEKICIDGGIGFAKSREQNLYLLENYSRLSSLGYPLLLGTSRKSLFGGKAEDRLEATKESTRHAARNGVLFVRVHDVKENAEAIREVLG